MSRRRHRLFLTGVLLGLLNLRVSESGGENMVAVKEKK
jgi:hypothetical protein